MKKEIYCVSYESTDEYEDKNICGFFYESFADALALMLIHLDKKICCKLERRDDG